MQITSENIDKSTNFTQFNISLNSYEGPIDLLLELARKQKVDLSDISILELAEQYIIFINKYQDIHLEIAADYLVMAAWLTYLKSRLLLPREAKDDDHTPEELEEALKYQLQRLEAFQSVSKKLYSRNLIGRDIFYGGSSEGLKVKFNISYSSTLFDLLHSYSSILQKQDRVTHLTIAYSELYSVDNAIQRLKGIFGNLTEWTNFLNIIPKFNGNKIINKSILSSNFVASLELAKNGFIEVKQNNVFGNIFIKIRQ
tara:strand:+ start:110 stop:877 length:768 start_codon:yes stop_codon:yes gene_type:complete